MAIVNLRNSLLLFVTLYVGLLLAIDGVQAESESRLAPKFGSGVGAPTINVLYCYSCGYRRAFEEYSNLLLERYPSIQITGGNYEPAGLNYAVSKFVLLLKIGIIAAVLLQYDVFATLGWDTPAWWTYLLSNKIYACIMIFFLGNMIEGQFVASGAFEIALNDVPIWSKLQTGRVPSPQELFQIIDSQFQFIDPVQENPNFVK